MADLVVFIILAVIIGGAVIYLIKAQKSGVKCIGCPDGGACAQKSIGGCGCGCGNRGEETDVKVCCRKCANEEANEGPCYCHADK